MDLDLNILDSVDDLPSLEQKQSGNWHFSGCSGSGHGSARRLGLPSSKKAGNFFGENDLS